jgi:serine/threonine protein kinase
VVPDLQERLQAALGDAFRLERELARGGMSRLFLATETSLNRQVVVKVLPPESTSEVSSERFKQEIEVAAHLQHPNILPVLTAGTRHQLLYYITPYVPGESLRHRLTREGKLPVADAIRILHEIADALAYAHAEGVIHRDIKPENILLEGGHAVLTDFGVARALVESRSGSRLTDTGLALGTPGYMSPEQAAGERDVDARADVYALAVVGYEILAGFPPFAGPTAQAVILAHFTVTPKPLGDLRPEIPPDVANAIARALAKDPNARLQTAAQFRDALGATSERPSRRRQSKTRWLGVGVTIAAVIVASVLGIVLSRRHRTMVIPSASVIAVVPFTPSTPDTALARLGRDLVVTISANLDGVADIRTVDALTILAQAHGTDGGWSLQEGVTLARRLGASSVVHGSLVRVGNRVRLDFGLFTTDSAKSITRAAVTAAPDSLTALTDSATWTLLREVWRSRTPPTPSLAAVTTRSVPALRAFLEGERNILENRWEAAAEAFSRAIEADSTFWFAYRRFAYSRQWRFDPVDSTVIKAYRDHRFDLPERERLLIEAGMTDSARVTLSRLQEITRRYPDYWPGWLAYADRFVHVAPLLGYTSADARAALQRTLRLNPNLAPVWQHLFWVAIPFDTVTAVHALDEYTRLGGGPATTADLGIDETRLFRLDLQFRRTGDLDRAQSDTLARELARAQTRPIGEYYLLWQHLPRLSLEVNRRAVATVASTESAIPHRRAFAMAWAGRGAWDSALTAMDELLDQAAEDRLTLDGYSLAAVGTWVGAVDPETASRWKTRTAAVAFQQSTRWRAESAWLDGVLAAARRDRASLSAARAALRGVDDPTVRLLDRSLAAFELEMTGARGRAARDLATLEWERPDLSEDGYDDHPWLLGVNRLAASRWLLAEGDTIEAARLLVWTDAFALSPGYLRAHSAMASITYLERARITDARGQANMARQYYQEFLRRYDMPAPRHTYLVNEAKLALTRLKGRETQETVR